MRQTITIAVLVGFLWASAIGLIYTKHQSRQLVAELQNLQEERDALHIEWTQLLLEQGAWATYSRVEKMARESLNMQLPTPGDVQVVGNNEAKGLANGRSSA